MFTDKDALIEKLKKEVAHWKANHDNMVRLKKKVMRERDNRCKERDKEYDLHQRRIKYGGINT